MKRTVALPPDPPAYVLRLMRTLGVTVTIDRRLPRPHYWQMHDRGRDGTIRR